MGKEEERLLAEVNKKLDDFNSESIETLKEIRSIYSQILQSSGKIDNKIDSKIESISKRIDMLDEALRGNSKSVGVFEQIRNMRRDIIIISSLLLFLFGFKLFGSNMIEWLNNIKDYLLN